MSLEKGEKTMTQNEGKNSKAALLLPFRCIVFVLVFVIGAALTGKNVKDISNWWSIVASAVNIVTILLIVLVAKKHGKTYRKQLNLKKGLDTPKRTIILVILFCAVGMSGMYAAGLICYGSVMPKAALDVVAPIPLALAVINLIVLPATVSFAEDGLYLGLGVNSFKNKYAAIFIPAFFYALQHCFIPTMFDAKYMLYRFLSFLPLTVIFCRNYQKNKNPLPIMIAHAILDFATGMMILLTSASSELYEKWGSMI